MNGVLLYHNIDLFERIGFYTPECACATGSIDGVKPTGTFLAVGHVWPDHVLRLIPAGASSRGESPGWMLERVLMEECIWVTKRTC